MGLRVDRQVGALWKVLSQQAIGVLVRPALPRALRIAKIYVDFGRQRCAPRVGPCIGATATKRCLLPLRATAHCNCRRPSANQWLKRRRDNTPSPGMALCGYSVGITQIIWARTAAGCSSRSTPASIRKVALFLLIHTAFISPETMRWEFHAAIFVDEVSCKIPC